MKVLLEILDLRGSPPVSGERDEGGEVVTANDRVHSATRSGYAVRFSNGT